MTALRIAVRSTLLTAAAVLSLALTACSSAPVETGTSASNAAEIVGCTPPPTINCAPPEHYNAATCSCAPVCDPLPRCHKMSADCTKCVQCLFVQQCPGGVWDNDRCQCVSTTPPPGPLPTPGG